MPKHTHVAAPPVCCCYPHDTHTCADKAPGSNAKKPRVATLVKKTQSNTLDMWFKAAAPKAAKTSAKSDADSHDDDAPVTTSGESPVAADEVTRVTPPVEKKRSGDAVPSSAKKLVQRRIHINDPCRVCEAARTEDTSRCELRCLGCDMTVHKVRPACVCASSQSTAS